MKNKNCNLNKNLIIYYNFFFQYQFLIQKIQLVNYYNKIQS